MYTDSHTHLNSPQLFPDYKTHIQDFLDMGGVGLSIIGTNLEDSIMAIEIVEGCTPLVKGARGFIGATIGYHPEFARDCDIGALEELIIKHRQDIIGIGEIGTDLHREPYREFYDIQKKAFYDQCLLARKYNLPVVIHSRNDFEGSFDIIKQFTDLKIYFHCRGYTIKELEILNKLINPSKSNSPLSKGDQGGLRVGFCGNVSYPKAQELRESFQFCLDNDINILIETDAPYLAAQAIRGQQNTPAKIIHTYQYISDYFNIPLSELQKKTHDNFMSLYYPSVATEPSV